MAAPPNGRVGGGAGSPARTGGQVRGALPLSPASLLHPSPPARALRQPSSVPPSVWPLVFGRPKGLNRG